MKYPHSRRTFLPLHVLAGLLFSGVVVLATQDQSILLNGGFEEGDFGWDAFGQREGAETSTSFSVVDDRPRSGTGTARLWSDAIARHGFEASRFPVEAGEKYRISAWVRADDSTKLDRGAPGPVVRLTLLGSDGRSDAPGGHYFLGLNRWTGRNQVPPAIIGELPKEWTQMEAVVEIPPDTGYVVPHFFSWNAKGALFFDDITITKEADDTLATELKTGPLHELPVGPPLTYEERRKDLFASLDLDRAGLESVKAALAAGDLEAAEKAFAGYLRNRPFAGWKEPGGYNAEVANKAREGTVVGGFVQIPHTFPNNDFDWLFNATDHQIPPVAHNREWQWQLNRMFFWYDMGVAYLRRADQNDHSFAKAWVKQFRSFIEQNPAPTRRILLRESPSSWRTIEAGLRIGGTWPMAFSCFVNAPPEIVTDKDLVAYAHSSLEHARFLSAYPSSHNILMMEMRGLYGVGVLFPEFREAASWRRYAIQKVREEMFEQFFPDGAHYELTPAYHSVAHGNAADIVNLAKEMDRMGRPELLREIQEISPGYISSLEKGYDFLLYLATPELRLPRLSDSGEIDIVGRVFSHAQILFPERSDFRWLASRRKEGSPPSSLSHAFPYAGYLVMRSSWEPDANYLVLDAGPLGYGHSHHDKLNLVFWAYGREILFDGGGGEYESSPFRAYAMTTYSHNTVLVDGRPQTRIAPPADENGIMLPRTTGMNSEATGEEALRQQPPLKDIVWESTPAFDYAGGVYDEGYHAWHDQSEPARVRHTRRVLFIKPDLAVVADTLEPQDGKAHDYQARWHLLPTESVYDEPTKTVVTTAKRQPNLAIVPLRTENLTVKRRIADLIPPDYHATEQHPDYSQLAGWNVRSQRDRKPGETETNVPATTVLHERHGSGTKSFLTLLAPIRAGKENPVRSVRVIDQNTTEVSMDDGRLVFITADLNDPKSKLSFEISGKPRGE